jgi:hypothetical protein
MSGEQAQGTPYSNLSVETCCTITWGEWASACVREGIVSLTRTSAAAMCVEMLRYTGSSLVADELELSLFNSGLFLLSPSGRWCVYNSPMSGVRQSTTIEIAFQAMGAASELSCCSVNGPR